MLDLILDTSTDPCFVLLCEEKGLISSRFFPDKHNLSSSLVPTIEELLKPIPNKVDRIFVGIGPGSYTGVRVAVSVANSLSLSWNIPLYPFCSLLAFIPPSIPEGSFAYLAPSAFSTAFILEGNKTKDRISAQSSHKILEKEPLLPLIETFSSVISLEPEKTAKLLSLPTTSIVRGSFNSDLLIPYLRELAIKPPSPPNILYLHSL